MKILYPQAFSSRISRYLINNGFFLKCISITLIILFGTSLSNRFNSIACRTVGLLRPSSSFPAVLLYSSCSLANNTPNPDLTQNLLLHCMSARLPVDSPCLSSLNELFSTPRMKRVIVIKHHGGQQSTAYFLDAPQKKSRDLTELFSRK